jgi:hypothetical protein
MTDLETINSTIEGEIAKVEKRRETELEGVGAAARNAG